MSVTVKFFFYSHIAQHLPISSEDHDGMTMAYTIATKKKTDQKTEVNTHNVELTKIQHLCSAIAQLVIKNIDGDKLLANIKYYKNERVGGKETLNYCLVCP